MTLLEYKSFNASKTGDVKNYEVQKFLDRLLPKHIQESLNSAHENIGETYKNVTLLFADIVGFTEYSSTKKPHEVVTMLAELFMDFDKVCLRKKLYKMYTIGDCYVALGF